MGMFDTIICEYPLPDGNTETSFQSKNFDCMMDTYKITTDGNITVFRYDIEENGIEEMEWRAGLTKIKRVNKRWEIVPFHGVFNFYGGQWSNELQSHQGTWREYVAKFTDGKLMEITVATPREIHQERKDILAAIEEVEKEHSDRAGRVCSHCGKPWPCGLAGLYPHNRSRRG